MYSSALQDMIRELATTTNLSHQQIAARLGMSYNAVRTWIRRNLGPKKVGRPPKRDDPYAEKYVGDPIKYPDISRPPKRCHGCGALVHMPCLKCQIATVTV